MRLFTEYDRAVRTLFNELELPMEGISYTWLCKLNALHILIHEAEVHYPSFSVVVNDLVANLHGSAAYTWAMRETLEEMRLTIGTIEGHMREFDHVVYGASPMYQGDPLTPPVVH